MEGTLEECGVLHGRLRMTPSSWATWATSRHGGVGQFHFGKLKAVVVPSGCGFSRLLRFGLKEKS